ncbi:MAG: type II toxin-antitoxin system VapC family toxin [Acidimicrobiia bacterium]
MTLTYLDTSAVLKLVLDERESDALVEALTADRRLVASWLLHTEMHCAAGRHPEALHVEAIRAVLDTVDLVDLTRGDLLAAGTHAPLRSHDALRLAVAIRVGVDEVVTYDDALAAAAAGAGLVVLAPGTG